MEEFLAFENASPTRHEFVAGRVYAMSGTTARHNQIVLNIYARLRAASKMVCARRTSSISRCALGATELTIPDSVVVRSPHDGDTLIFDDPCLLVEVTSRSTRRIDRGEKLDAYISIPSLQGYLIAEHDRRHVTSTHARPGASGAARRWSLPDNCRSHVPRPHSRSMTSTRASNCPRSAFVRSMTN